MIIQALGTEITGEKADGKLDNNPYVFTPNANKLYFSAKLGFDNWQSDHDLH